MGTISRKARRTWGLTACAGVVAGALAGPSLAGAQVFYPTDRYDCYAHQAITGGRVYVDSYQFQSGNRYAVGYRSSTSKIGLSKQFGHGTYKVVGKKIVSSSGYLTQRAEYLLIETSGLALVKNSGAFQSIGCYDPTKHSLPTGGSSSFLEGAASVTYSCYETEQNLSDGYSELSPITLTFWSDGTYLKQYSFRGPGWKQSGDTIDFTGGPFWGTYAHDVGTWYPSGGITMPHAQGTDASLTFSLVIRDTVAEGGIPPSVEFATTGPDSVTPASFLYCKK